MRSSAMLYTLVSAPTQDAVESPAAGPGAARPSVYNPWFPNFAAPKETPP